MEGVEGGGRREKKGGGGGRREIKQGEFERMRGRFCVEGEGKG